MTEVFSSGRCNRCGMPVGFEDGMRMDFCDCDPRCESCGRQFSVGISKFVCDECLEEEVREEFSEEFLNTLSCSQMRLLLRDFARRYE
jgi:hypothetical protein